MTNKNKQLLLKDLCAMLPYGVKVRMSYDKNTVETRELGLGSLHDIIFNNAEGNPYLRPMSSMTEEEKKEFDEFICIDEDAWLEKENGYANQAIIMSDGIDWLNAHHFDYRGLIPVGLALEAPEDMYKEK